MQFSDTTNKNGGIQEIEFWTNLGDAGVSGNPTLLKVMTSQVNAAFEDILPLVLSYTDYLRWDDTNHTSQPFGTFNLVSGQADYNLTTDGSSLSILNVTNVRVLQSSSTTTYTTLERMTMDDSRALTAMSPNPTETGTPTMFLEKNNTIFLYLKPNYSATNGIKIFYEREQSYFVSTDTSKEPGIPKPFHRLLFRMAALNWLLVNKPENGTLVTRLEKKISDGTREIQNMISMKIPTRSGMRPSKESNK